MALGLQIGFEPIKTVPFNAIGVGYVGIGTALAHPSREIQIQNLTDVTLVFSDDGLVDKFKLPANSVREIDFTANRASNSSVFCLAEGKRLYVRKDTASPSLGEVNVSSLYEIIN